MQVVDVQTVRAVRHELSRHAIDTSEATVHVTHGVVHLNGRVRPIRGHEHEFGEELTKLQRVLPLRPGIREVIFEWAADGYKDGSTSKTRSRS